MFVNSAPCHAVDRHTAYFGSVEEKLRYGEHLFHTHRKILFSTPDVLCCFEKLQEAGTLLTKQMVRLNLGSLCCRCAGTTNGGCCSTYMAGEIDSIQIVVNRMAGVDVRQYDNGDECFFLGPAGCIFSFKPMFCLNYNCHQIHHSCSGGEIIQLENAAARLLRRQNDMERLILDVIDREILRHLRRSADDPTSTTRRES